MSKPDIVSTSEAADLLDVTVATVNRWAAEGKLPVVHRLSGVTGARLYSRSDVEALAAELASHRCPTCGHRLERPAEPEADPDGAAVA